MTQTGSEIEQALTFRRYEDGDHKQGRLQEVILNAGHSHQCPVYVHRSPPCQANCPSGEDIRGWLQIVRGIEKPPADLSWQQYAFQRVTSSNPFPSIMGRVCPAPCQEQCNRNAVDDTVGINAVEQFIGDCAADQGFKFTAPAELQSGRVAIVGGGPAGLAAAFQLRKKGYASVIYEAEDALGGLMRYGIPGYRIPREILEQEIQRILDLGDIEVKLTVRIGQDLSVGDLGKQYDAVLWTVGCQKGYALPVENGDAQNCVTGIEFLKAFNEGRLKTSSQKVVCVGGGDTSIDVVSVARRLGQVDGLDAEQQSETIIKTGTSQDSGLIDQRRTNDVTLTSLFEKSKMTATEHEVQDAIKEGVRIFDGTMPLKVLLDENGKARALRMAYCDMDGNKPIPREGTEFEIECDLIVSAIGQTGELTGLESLDNGKNLMSADVSFQLKGKPGHFVAGDILQPHLLTTAIGQARKVADSIDQYLQKKNIAKRDKIDVSHFDLLEKMTESGLQPVDYNRPATRSTDQQNFAVHNYENRSGKQVIFSDELYLAHFPYDAQIQRRQHGPDADHVLNDFEERTTTLDEAQAVAEAKRCISCGMCFECDNCVIYCPQDAVKRVKKDQATTGRYVETDYNRCIGCHICADVCPAGYIDMGMGG